MTEITDKKQKTWLYKKGQSGNPLGRPKGSFSIKSRIIQKLEENPKKLDEMVNFLIKNHPALLLQMIDGRPSQNNNLEDKESLTINIVNYSNTNQILSE